MELKPGFKYTEIGVIPEDWEASFLGKFASFRTGPFGSALHKSDYIQDGVPVINPMHINDGVIEPTSAMSITEEAAANLAEFRMKNGEIVIGRRGDMGRCAVVQPHQDGWLCGTGSMIVRPSEGFEPRFLARLLATPTVVSAIEDASVGSTMVNLNQSTLANLRLQRPPVPEQKAIAEALSDVDASIATLSRLIAKKRDLWQGAMQRLLTGQTRLRGFTSQWKVKRLGDHVAFLKNGIQSRAQLTLDDPIRYLHYGDIHVSPDLSLDLSNAYMPRLPTFAAAGLTKLEDGDLIFVDASEDLKGVGKSLEIVGAIGVEAVSGQHTIAARFDKFVLADGFKRYLQFIPAFTTHLRRLAAGTKVYATNRKHIASAELQLPEIDEQIAIAGVLSDMELEISALEARSNKTRALKQAMIQALLTGRVRLPVLRDTEPQTKETAHACTPTQ